MADDLINTILSTLGSSADGRIEDTLVLAASLDVPHDVLVGAVKSLASSLMVDLKANETKEWHLTEEGAALLSTGVSPEAEIFNALPADGSGVEFGDLRAAQPGPMKFGWAHCMKAKWVKKAGSVVTRAVESIEDATIAQLAAVKAGGDSGASAKALKDLKKRKLITLVVSRPFAVWKGAEFALVRVKQHANLTKEMLEKKTWGELSFKGANLQTMGQELSGGHLHPLLKVRTEFRRILLQMGFTEMPTSQWVESSFWNFDTLFQPQSHPARDAHDTFFIRKPAATLRLPEDYLSRVQTMHESGGHGSRGYRYAWKRAEAEKNMLRTHTTAVSSKMLKKLGEAFEETGTFTPKKYFSIDRVFRNETMDATHLAEFHQVEFFVADYGLSLGHLIGMLKDFFARIGIAPLKFKPAYNPYTEPSMEIFGFHPDLGEHGGWTEIGNSGIFRPEMLAPMGLPEGVNVIAGGLSLERPTMIKYRVDDIRKLFGHKVDLVETKTMPVVRL